MTNDEKLMQQALDALEAKQKLLNAVSHTLGGPWVQSKTAEALRTRLAQPEPEPVAWTWEKEGKRYFMTHDPSEVEAYHNLPSSTPLYTAPPQREWQGLTDWEFSEMHTAWRETPDSLWDLYNAIEAKLREKNT